MFINKAETKYYKIVYWGTGLSGKSTLIKYIYDNTQENLKTNLISVSSETDRILYCSIKDNNAEFFLYAIPGAVYYEESLKRLLKNADAIVFVVDSIKERLEANISSFHYLQECLEFHKYEFNSIPIVFCVNKRDIGRFNTSKSGLTWAFEILPVEELIEKLEIFQFPIYETIGITGFGVLQAFEKIKSLILDKRIAE